MDASRADFSDRLSAKKQSYLVTSRRWQDGEDGEIDIDDGEGLARRIARLSREVEEVRAILREQDETRRQDPTSSTQTDSPAAASDLASLSKALDTIQESQRKALSAHAKLAQQLSQPLPAASATAGLDEATGRDVIGSSADTLAKIVAFDSRLASLEAAFGLGAVDLAASSNTSVLPVLPTLSILDQQIALLSNPDHLSRLESRVQLLGSEKPQTNGDAKSEVEASTLSAEDIVQLRSLHALVPTITNLGPSVLPTIERLKSLRTLHQQAAKSGQFMDDIERRQAETDKDIRAWQDGLSKVEEAIRQAEAGFKSDTAELEKWVHDLETRINPS